MRSLISILILIVASPFAFIGELNASSSQILAVEDGVEQQMEESDTTTLGFDATSSEDSTEGVALNPSVATFDSIDALNTISTLRFESLTKEATSSSGFLNGCGRYRAFQVLDEAWAYRFRGYCKPG